MNDFKSYERAIQLAVKAHNKQFDKAGMPYILHPLRVAEALDTEEERIVGVLHDVVEDTKETLVTIYNAFGGAIADAVECMTKHGKVNGKYESYRDYLDRVRSNPISLNVKLADMTDNSQPHRLETLPVKRHVRLAAKYSRGRHYLLTGEWYQSEDLDRVIRAVFK